MSRPPRAVMEELFDDLYWVTIDDGREFQATGAEVDELVLREGLAPWRTEHGGRVTPPDIGDADIPSS